MNPIGALKANQLNFSEREEPIVRTRTFTAQALLFAAGVLFFVAAADAAEIKVMSSAGFKAAYLELATEFERTTGHKIVNAWGPSMGNTPQAVPNRIARGEPVDVVIMVGDALEKLIKDGKVVASNRTDLARAVVAAAVRAGAPKPDLGSVEAFKRALENAKSIAYSDSASGVYVSTEMFRKLGIEDEMKGKARQIPATPVGEIVAKGEAELGFQQISELKPVQGIDIIGPLPDPLQKITVFSAGIATASKEPEAGKALIKFLTSPAVRDEIVKSGLEPIETATTH